MVVPPYICRSMHVRWSLYVVLTHINHSHPLWLAIFHHHPCLWLLTWLSGVMCPSSPFPSTSCYCGHKCMTKSNHHMGVVTMQVYAILEHPKCMEWTVQHLFGQQHPIIVVMGARWTLSRSGTSEFAIGYYLWFRNMNKLVISRMNLRQFVNSRSKFALVNSWHKVVTLGWNNIWYDIW